MKREHELFRLTLGLPPPREVVKLDFDAATKKLTIGIDFPKGNLRFGCSECGIAGCGVDTKPMRWRHLNVQHEAFIEARV